VMLYLSIYSQYSEPKNYKLIIVIGLKLKVEKLNV